MAQVVGIVLFALAILVSVSLHEAGHMLTAKWFGMKVSRYFVGFGPTVFSFRRGETEYGLKWIPLGGFCKIVGMTPQDDDVDPADEPRAMWRFPVWKRTIVMAAGSVTHFMLAFLIFWGIAVFSGLPNPKIDTEQKMRAQPAYVQMVDCVVTTPTATGCKPGDPPSAAKAAGLRDGDQITSFDNKPVASYNDLISAIRSTAAGPVPVAYQRDGQSAQTTITVIAAERPPVDDPSGKPEKVGAIGVAQAIPPGIPATVRYGALDGFGQAGKLMGQSFTRTVEAMEKLPGKLPALWHSLSGGERDQETPISVVGASRLGGETVQAGLWPLFFVFLASLNFFIGVFNLLPLLPLDGGHIAIAWFERLRSWVYKLFKRPDPGRVDYLKLMPVTYAVILVFGAFTLLTVAADIVNPISILR